MKNVGQKKLVTQLKNFIEHDIWSIKLNEHSRRKSFLIRQLRILLIARKGFTEGKARLKASALTFYSLLSFVPVIAVIFAIAKGFNLQERLEVFIQEQLSGQQEVIEKTIEFANNMLENTKGGLMAGIGVVLLFWSVMKVLGNIEAALNDVWQIRKSRPWIRKFSDYLAIIVIGTIFLILSSSVNVYISTQFDNMSENLPIFGYIGPFVRFLIKLIPYILIWFMFTGLYIIMPNTKVKFSSALIGGIIAGTAFQLLQWGYVYFQVGVSKYNAIYGSFAALPLFLIWMQISWLIIIIGAEISFANQNVEKYEIESESLSISKYRRKILTLLVANLIVKDFALGKPRLTSSNIAHTLHLPVRLVRDMLFDLVDCGILTETITDSPKENAFVPAMDINQMTLGSVILKLDESGVDDFKIDPIPEYKTIKTTIDEFNKHIETSKSNVLLKDI